MDLITKKKISDPYFVLKKKHSIGCYKDNYS